MKAHVVFLAMIAAVGFAIKAAPAAYVVNSRLSEFSHNKWDWDVPELNEYVYYSTTGMGELLVPGPWSGAPAYHHSALTAAGATYSGYASTMANGTNGRRGYTEISHFELVFTLTEATNFTLTGSLHRMFNGTATLALDPLTSGASAAWAATATGSPQNNFAPNLINWSGTLLAGQYRLSIFDKGNLDANGTQAFAESNFVFQVPAPTSTAAMALFALAAARRRRL